MTYTVKRLPKSEIELTITVSEETMKAAEKRAKEEIAKHTKVKGFRPGKVPANVVDKHVSADAIKGHTIELSIQKSYSEAVIKEKLEVVSRPHVHIDKEDPLTFTAKVAVMPEVEVKDHKSIKIAKKESKIEKKDIEEVLTNLQKQGIIYKDVQREAKNGDRAELEFEGFEGDKPVEGTKSSNHPVILGENSLIPGFEEKVIGMKIGDKKEFDITFPKDYHSKKFQGKKMNFKVELQRLEEAIVPEIDEALIEKFTGKKMKLDELTKEIEENLQAKKDTDLQRERENEYIEALLKKIKVELPESLIAEESEQILTEMKQNIISRKNDWDEFLERAKTTEDELRKKYAPEAERRIKIRLALQNIIQKEEIKVTDEDLSNELEKVKGFYPGEQHDKIQEDFESGKLKMNILNRLTLSKFFDKVLL
ncbi:trigger factor [Candidatus Gracilibacteria bacterium]|nr:trigger factor [Candidatus Gracilibacteria bacterium]